MNDFLVYLAVGVVALLVLLALVYRGLGALVKWFALHRLPLEERSVFHQKARLLASPAVVEFLAPAVEFQRELGEGEKFRRPLGCLTPYPEAVASQWKKYKHGRKAVAVAAQVKAAAEELVVAELPEERQPANAGVEHFVVTVPLDGRPEATVMGLASLIKAQLGLYSVDASLSPDYLGIEFVCHELKPVDRLEGRTFGVEFFRKNPAQNPWSLPLAMAEDGSSWSLPTHHTLIYGVTGAGKGSVLHAIIRQLSPFVRQGKVVLYGIDPKMEDLDKYRLSSLFDTITTEQDDSEALVFRFADAMMNRARRRQADREAGVTPKEVGTASTPIHVLMVDEFSSFLMEAQSKRGNAVFMSRFQSILAMGRSLGFFVVAAGQNLDKDLLQRLRTNFVNGIALRAENTYWSDLLLGQSASSGGFDASLILPSSRANNWATAGIGFVKEEAGEPLKVRFPYSSDSAVAALVADFPLEKNPQPVSPSWATVEPPRRGTDLRDLSIPQLEELCVRLEKRLEERENPRARSYYDSAVRELRLRRKVEAVTGKQEPPLPPLGLPPLEEIKR